jgi:hypothetical protein
MLLLWLSGDPEVHYLLFPVQGLLTVPAIVVAHLLVTSAEGWDRLLTLPVWFILVHQCLFMWTHF